jgi:hypothetical protein
LAAWMQAQVEGDLLESASTRLFTSKLGWSMEKLGGFIAEVKKDMTDPKIKAYSPMWFDFQSCSEMWLADIGQNRGLWKKTSFYLAYFCHVSPAWYVRSWV